MMIAVRIQKNIINLGSLGDVYKLLISGSSTSVLGPIKTAIIDPIITKPTPMRSIGILNDLPLVYINVDCDHFVVELL